MAIALAGRPERWAALGFAVEQGGCSIGGVSLEFGSAGEGITGWAVSGLESELDGLPNIRAGPPSPPATHSNGAIGIDHLVVGTPDFDRTAAALEGADMPLRRVVARPEGDRMGFRRLGPVILELVEARGERSDGPACFWGLVVVVDDLDSLAERLGDRLGSVHDAVQPGRRIATLRESAGLGVAVAFMNAEGG
jgi:hypothetical protein